jgi:hypothetical protein
MTPDGDSGVRIHAAKGVRQMKKISTPKAALGSGAAILLGGFLAAAPAQASTGTTVPCNTQALIAAISSAIS